MRTHAYINAGRLIADCPYGCGNAELVGDESGPTVSTFLCSYCKALSGLDWPDDLGDILAVLALRPIPHTRNWAPAGHRQIRGTPHEAGQSVQDLMDENADHGVQS